MVVDFPARLNYESMLSLVGYDLKSNFGEGVRVNEVIQLSIHSSVLVKDVEAEKVYLGQLVARCLAVRGVVQGHRSHPRYDSYL